MRSEQEQRREQFKDGKRLNKYVAHAGVCSRRKADELIKQGKVKVNGHVIYQMGYKVQDGDEVMFDGKVLAAEQKMYVLLNKPKNFITTTDDEKNRKTVMDLVKTAAKGNRIYPVGRLDRMTTGLLLLTNDGKLAQKLAHPSGEIQKIYEVTLDKDLSPAHFQFIKNGQVQLEEGKVLVDEIAFPIDRKKNVVGLTIHIGWNRVVRRTFESLGYEVKKLDRVMYAHLTKLDLPRGKWRYLTTEEVRNLKHFNESGKSVKR